jgi:hypothetical protein
MSIISTSELDAIARRGLTDIEAIFGGQMDDETLEKANMAIKLLRIGSGRYSAETNRMALAFRLARALEVPRQELVPLWRQLAGSDAAERAQRAIEAGDASTPAKKGK